MWGLLVNIFFGVLGLMGFKRGAPPPKPSLESQGASQAAALEAVQAVDTKETNNAQAAIDAANRAAAAGLSDPASLRGPDPDSRD